MYKKTIIQTSSAPHPIGPSSQAVGFGEVLFLSAQIAIDPHTGQMAHGGVEAQTRQAMLNLRAILHGAGLDFSHVLQATIQLKNMTDLKLIDPIYGEFFDENPPARTTSEVSRLPQDALVQIAMVAAVPRPLDEDLPHVAALASEQE